MAEEIDKAQRGPPQAEELSISNEKTDFEAQRQGKGADRGAQLIGDQRIELTEEDNVRIRRKIDKLILPVLVWVYFNQILDVSSPSLPALQCPDRILTMRPHRNPSLATVPFLVCETTPTLPALSILSLAQSRQSYSWLGNHSPPS